MRYAIHLFFISSFLFLYGKLSSQFNGLSVTINDITMPARVGCGFYHVPARGLFVFGGNDGRGTPTIFGSSGFCTVPTSGQGVNSAGPNMVMPRTDFAHVQFPNGNILLAGGMTTTSVTNSCEMYDASTNTFRSVAPMGRARQYAQAVLMQNGKVLVVGGDTTKTIEIYDPINNTWTYGRNSYTKHQMHASATLQTNGGVYIVGDMDPNSDGVEVGEIYSPDSDFWNVPNGFMSGHRRGCGAVLLPNSDIVIAGGRNSKASGVHFVSDYYYAEVDTLNAIRERPILVALNNGNALLIGNDYRDDPNLDGLFMEVYDNTTYEWTQLPFRVCCARSYASHVKINNKIYTFGGQNPGTPFADGLPYLITDNTLLLIEAAELPVLELFPTPAQEQVTIHLPGSIVDGSSILRVYDLLGAEVLRISVNSSGTQTIDVNSLYPSSYLVVLETGGKKVASGKILKK